MGRVQAFKPGDVAVVAGAADGIGLAACKSFVKRGMKVCMADINGEHLAESSEKEVSPLVDGGAANLMTATVDVAKREQLESLRDGVYQRFGRVDVLMNNAGIPRGGESWDNYDGWREALEVNLWGQINGVAAFVPRMLEQGTRGVVVNTGSKQGITNPPGAPSYNVSKAAVRAFTENLEHSLRNIEDGRLSAHLLVPGFTYTGLMRPFFDQKPDAAWSSEQVVDFMIERVSDGQFYILCPDNEVTPEMDAKRMQWSIDDLIKGRPALSRWHPDFKDEFDRFCG